MFVKNINDCKAFTANDGCRIREWLHPEKDAVNLPYSVAEAVVSKGQSSYRHRLKQTEIYLILEGSGLMHVEDETREVIAGDSVIIPGGAMQWVDNTGEQELRFLAIVSPPWREEDDLRMD